MTALPGKKKKILIIVENLSVPFDKRVWNEANTLRAAGYEISVICPKSKLYNKGYENINGIHIYRHPLPVEGNNVFGYLAEYSAALFWELILAFKIFLTRGFDAIHACNPPDTIFIVGLIFKCFGKKFVFDYHDISPELFAVKFGEKNILYKLIRFLEKSTFMTADISIATNESYKEIAIKRGGMRPDKVFVVRSGPDISKMNSVLPVKRLKEGKDYMVGYVGVIAKQEGVDYLLRAASYIRNDMKRNDIMFAIIGSGPEVENLKKYSKELGLANTVKFTGRIPDRELIEYLSTSDVCVNTDVANEMNDKSTMNKIMEYMALEKPIVQFDLKEGRFSAQEASLYARKNDEVDMARKIVELIESPEKRKKMGEFGRRRVEKELAWKYSKGVLLNAYEKLFNRACQKFNR
ncbi:MAG: glycosyltransferase family 4 protein [Candidatus Omnitrophica bacterium]|nr:glycosyltransferase family 4 protein [Candidatus Omnitrophota bacterium]